MKQRDPFREVGANQSNLSKTHSLLTAAKKQACSKKRRNRETNVDCERFVIENRTGHKRTGGIESYPVGNFILGGIFAIIILSPGILFGAGAGGGAAGGAGPLILRLPPGVNPTSFPWAA